MLFALVIVSACFFMSKSLLSISRRIAGKTETVELANQPAMALQKIQRLKDKLKRFYDLLPWLTEEQKEKIQVVRKEFKAWEDENNPKMADLKFPDANGFCSHSLRPPREEAIKRLCKQLG